VPQKNIFLTGLPGCGKSTITEKNRDALAEEDLFGLPSGLVAALSGLTNGDAA
jgi:nucleoside-triphosphatase THEP1